MISNFVPQVYILFPLQSFSVYVPINCYLKLFIVTENYALIN